LYFDFTKDRQGDVLTEIVNISRATIKEALDFKKVLDDDLAKNNRKIVIDLRQCSFMDSTFLGTLVVTLKRIKKQGGEMVLVKPTSFAYDMLEITGTLKIFKVFETAEEAVDHLSELVVQ
jgi:anti-anti-sigma factor